MPSVTYDAEGNVLAEEAPTIVPQIGAAPRTADGQMIGVDGLPVPAQPATEPAADPPPVPVPVPVPQAPDPDLAPARDGAGAGDDDPAPLRGDAAAKFDPTPPTTEA